MPKKRKRSKNKKSKKVIKEDETISNEIEKVSISENKLNILPEPVLGRIFSYLYTYKYKDNEKLNYLLISKKVNLVISNCKCKICQKGIYDVDSRRGNDCCNHCGHVLEADSKKEERRKLYDFRKPRFASGREVLKTIGVVN